MTTYSVGEVDYEQKRNGTWRVYRWTERGYRKTMSEHFTEEGAKAQLKHLINLNRCMFFTCQETALGKPWGKEGTGKKFCKRHDDECRTAWKTSAQAVLSFWIRSGGNARRMAKTT